MGERVATLEDLLRPGLRAVCIGINPSLVSVAAGHYYQGRAGQRLLARLRSAGVIGRMSKGQEDDDAFAEGVGFTDVVKRPTRAAEELRSAELRHGASLLSAKLDAVKPKVAIFTYKQAAEAVFGRFNGNGFVAGLRIAHSEVFVMPGPYEATDTANARLRELSAHVRGLGVFDGLYEPGDLGALRDEERA